MQLLILDQHGIYIPQYFAQNFANYLTNQEKLKDEISDLLEGPDNEFYWDSWDTVLQDAELKDDNGKNFTLVQNGNLWSIEEGEELPEDFFS